MRSAKKPQSLRGDMYILSHMTDIMATISIFLHIHNLKRTPAHLLSKNVFLSTPTRSFGLNLITGLSKWKRGQGIQGSIPNAPQEMDRRSL